MYMPLRSSRDTSFLAIFVLDPMPGPEYGSSSFSSQLAAGVLLLVRILSASFDETGVNAAIRDEWGISDNGRGRERIVRELAGVDGWTASDARAAGSPVEKFGDSILGMTDSSGEGEVERYRMGGFFGRTERAVGMYIDGRYVVKTVLLVSSTRMLIAFSKLLTIYPPGRPV
jgi:hypothetical protein